MRRKRAEAEGHAGNRAGFSKYHSLDQRDPLVGSIIYDRYEIVAKIGSGGMGNVYQAIDYKDGGAVAIKMLGDHINGKDSMNDRFFIEAKAARMIDHPNVIRIMELGLFRNKRFCVMEYLDGPDLKRTIQNCREGREGMDLRRARGILMQACDALEAAHANNVIHRDLSPANIILLDSDFVKVIDFGLAKLTDGDHDLTQTGVIPGTPKYWAPEQIRKAKREIEDIDFRADLYSLGVIMYEMFCGEAPFDSKSDNQFVYVSEIMKKLMDEEPRRPRELNPDLPEEVESVILRALEKDPDRRFQNAYEMKRAIAAWCGGPAEDEVTTTIFEDVGGHSTETPHEAAGQEEAPVLPSSRRKDSIPISGKAVKPDAPVRLYGQLGSILDTEEVPDGKKGGRGWLKSAVVSVMLSGALIAGYHYRTEIMAFIDRHAGRTQEPVVRVEPPSPPQPAMQTDYEARIETEPDGAAVFDVTGGNGNRRRLGITPLTVRLQNGERTLLLEYRGRTKRIQVSERAPYQRVSVAGGRRAAPRGSGGVIVIEETVEEPAATGQPEGGEAPPVSE
ncbi:MAG: serine/threonine-protein kinase [Candidatus Micrarchaeota archaeon]